jgi:uncharacterized SAM-binding protein YcdF (DUF218 family)
VRRSLILVFILILFLVVVIPWMGLKEAGSLLVKRSEPRKADVIVVLGGEIESRAAKAAELYKRGFAPRVLVTGRTDGMLIKERLVSTGVPEDAISVEPNADSTFENARLSMPLLRQWNTKTALLVTSWFHSRRAISVFTAECGSVKFIPVPTEKVSFERMTGDHKLLRDVLLEYIKIPVYWFRYGICSVGWRKGSSGKIAGTCQGQAPGSRMTDRTVRCW